MRNIATCYSEHAVKVSDSYCSGPLNKSYISPKSTPCIQNVVTCTYKTQISNQKNPLFITIKWMNKLVCQGFFIKISSDKINSAQQNDFQHGFHQLHKVKGSTKLLLDDEFSVHWDLSEANFEAGPKPIGKFYILIILHYQYYWVLGDMYDEPVIRNLIKDIVAANNKLTMVSQCEHFSGLWNSQIMSSAKFSDIGVEHEIMIKCCPEDDGPRSPVLSVFIDKKRVVRVKRLQWNFRGNQVIFVDGLLVDVMWDVYGWHFDQAVGGLHSNNNSNSNSKKGGCGIFMFRTRSGLDSRLWLVEEEKKLADKNHDKPEFSLLICASNKNPG